MSSQVKSNLIVAAIAVLVGIFIGGQIGRIRSKIDERGIDYRGGKVHLRYYFSNFMGHSHQYALYINPKIGSGSCFPTTFIFGHDDYNYFFP